MTSGVDSCSLADAKTAAGINCARTCKAVGRAHTTNGSTAAVARPKRALGTSGSKPAARRRAVPPFHFGFESAAHQAVRLTKNVSKLSPVVADRTVVVAMMASMEPVCAISTVPDTAARAPA